MEKKRYKKGEVIFKENEPGTEMYEILSGNVEIVAEKGTEFEKKLTELKKGDVFGEMAIIEGYPRSATATALGAVELEAISGTELGDYFKTKPDMILDIMRHLSSRTRILTQDYMAVCRTINESDGNIGNLKKSENLWSKLKAFAGIYTRKGRGISLTEREEKELVHAEGLGENVFIYKKGDIIFEEGDNSGCMQDILGGKVGIYSAYGMPNEKLLTTLNANEFFGEMGMIDKDIRSATAVALEDNTYVENIYPEDLEKLFNDKPAKVLMILQHVSSRLRNLTTDYLTACKTASEIVEAEEKGEKLSSESEERMKLFCAISVYGRYYHN